MKALKQLQVVVWFQYCQSYIARYLMSIVVGLSLFAIDVAVVVVIVDVINTPSFIGGVGQG